MRNEGSNEAALKLWVPLGRRAVAEWPTSSKVRVASAPEKSRSVSAPPGWCGANAVRSYTAPCSATSTCAGAADSAVVLLIARIVAGFFQFGQGAFDYVARAMPIERRTHAMLLEEFLNKLVGILI